MGQKIRTCPREKSAQNWIESITKFTYFQDSQDNNRARSYTFALH